MVKASTRRAINITGATLIPLSTVAVVAGGIVWLTTLYNISEANAQKINSIENSYQLLLNKLQETRLDVREVKTKVDYIHSFYENQDYRLQDKIP